MSYSELARVVAAIPALSDHAKILLWAGLPCTDLSEDRSSKVRLVRLPARQSGLAWGHSVLAQRVQIEGLAGFSEAHDFNQDNEQKEK